MNRRALATWASAPGWVGALGAFALLLAFQQVVQGAVTQGATRRAVAAQHHDASWRCKALPGKQARLDCLALIAPMPTASALT